MANVKYAYIFRQDCENPGDLYSSISHYLGEQKAGIMLDVYATNIPRFEVDVVFVGGGAIFTTTKFTSGIDLILSNIRAKHKIVWGVGYTPELKSKIQTNYDLFGIRDYGIPNHTWVPCPSVLHKNFPIALKKKPYDDFLIINHWKRTINFPYYATRMTNKPNTMSAIINEIARHRYVLTTSYHAAYWATLLGKKTIVIGDVLPGKFLTMKHSPIIAKEFDSSLLEKAVVWENAYDECLKANIQYRDQVQNLTGISFPFVNL